MFTRFTLAAALLAALAARPAAAQSFTFDVNGAALNNTAASFTIQSGNVVTLSSSQDANGGFYVGANNGLFSQLSGSLLIDPGLGGDTLTVSFSQAVTNVSFNFGVVDLLASPGTAGDALALADGNGVTQSVVTSYLGNDLFPQGSVSFTDLAGFTSLTITDAQAFVIGLTNVPEPASIAAFGLGLAGLAALRRRRA